MVAKLNNVIFIQGVVIAVCLKFSWKTSKFRFSHALHYPDPSNLNWFRSLVRGYLGIILAITLLSTEGHETEKNAKQNITVSLGKLSGSGLDQV